MNRREERAIIKKRNIERRLLRDYFNPFTEVPRYFKKLYRLYPDQVLTLCQLLEPYLAGEKDHHLSVATQVFIALRLLATGTYQRVLGQEYLHPSSQTSVHRCFHRFLDAIVAESHRFIQFPKTMQSRQEVAEGFRRYTRIQNVLGLIDCYVLKLLKPRVNEEAFVHRQYRHSLNIQVICDSNHIITSVRVCPGSTSDKFIWKYSDAKEQMEMLRGDPQVMRDEGMYFILGDGGYTPSQIMLTPIHHMDEGTPEYAYTRELCAVRCKVEMTFGLQGGVWRSIKRERAMRYSPQVAGNVVTAAACLHNFRLRNGALLPAEQAVYAGNFGFRERENYDDGLALREMIIEEYF